MDIAVRIETWPLIYPFRITGWTYDAIELVVVTLRDGDHEGRGEAAGVDYLGETPAGIASAIASMRDAFRAGMDRERLQSLLPPGGARNALDCALWDMEAARSGQPVWQRAGVPAPKPCLTTWTIGAEPPEVVVARAREFAGARALKLKLIGDGQDVARVRAARAARPDIWLGVDGNQGFSRATLEQIMPALVEAGVALVEQPLPMDCDADLDGFNSPIPLAADESAQGLASIATLSSAFSVVNIKLDKCGGLTEALAMVEAARARGMQVMVGNMLGTSLAMAPAFIVGQLCDIVDLDGPVLLDGDRAPVAEYDDGMVWCPEDIWGGAWRPAHVHEAE
ncbi:L-alanine-DL-glutamate epimerase-like enolase superfamily enzyme [Sphingopyxis panaciterrae]|uniref:dipeptide epimerase n=1 Tax=Sphingopyxis panaciterrae TaxID=363841 RepID=UPI0014248ABE|nr:dipeptide epimerase [Sphingopyxis panaciterrae]NIJ38463.1 L-alanine-DL-glutamate epimerase-like enolase superfamily enzyme [Sphingopyxis panaciterrae]